MLCFSVTHFGAYDGRLKEKKKPKKKRKNGELTWKETLIKQYKKNNTYQNYGYEELEEKKEYNEATEEILKRRIIDRVDDLTEIEIKYYRARHPHLLLKQYKPAYVGNFQENLSDNKFHIGEIITDKNINSNQAIAGFEIC